LSNRPIIFFFGTTSVQLSERDMLGQLDRVRAPAAAERMFGARNTHPFPPETIIPPEWHVELETLADELGYRTTKAAEIQKNLRI
jgi:hypothetical protein